MITVVTPADPLTLVSLDEAKEWLKVDYTEDDAIITMLIKSAYNWAEKFTNSSILERTLRLTDDFHIVRLPSGPVQSIVSVNRIARDGAITAITDYSFRENLLTINEYFTYYCERPNEGIQVTYVAGLPVAEVEEAYKEAILKTVFSSYDIRGNEVTGTEGIAVSTTKITREAKDILRSYIMYL